MKILITGGTGLVGQELGQALVKAGHQVVTISRNASKAELHLSYPAEVVEGDLSAGPLKDGVLTPVDSVIHLMGEGVADGRWSDKRKDQIMQSRRQGTKNLWESLRGQKIKSLVSASAIGIYGERGDEELTELSARGPGFLADVCDEWEKAVHSPDIAGFESVRKVSLRIGVVLSAKGGALAKLIPIYQGGVGGVIASGKAWMSWIHLQDLVRLLIWSVENESVNGILNATAPEPVTNRQFTEALVSALDASMGPPVPAFALKVLYGEMSEVVLASQKVRPARAKDLGFQFQWPEITAAMNDICQHHRGGHQVLFAEQYLPITKEQAFPFFSAAKNLERITPPLLNFNVKAMSTPEIGAGTLIDYRLKIHGVPTGWRTLIQDWNPPYEFVDTQLKGPYKFWHHRHLFEDLGPGVLMKDIVRYKVPLGILGQAVAGSFVRGDVQKIFAYRRTYLHDLVRQGADAFSR